MPSPNVQLQHLQDRIDELEARLNDAEQYKTFILDTVEAVLDVGEHCIGELTGDIDFNEVAEEANAFAEFTFASPVTAADVAALWTPETAKHAIIGKLKGIRGDSDLRECLCSLMLSYYFEVFEEYVNKCCMVYFDGDDAMHASTFEWIYKHI